jgi:hypothetical protein
MGHAEKGGKWLASMINICGGTEGENDSCYVIEEKERFPQSRPTSAHRFKMPGYLTVSGHPNIKMT